MEEKNTPQPHAPESASPRTGAGKRLLAPYLWAIGLAWSFVAFALYYRQWPFVYHEWLRARTPAWKLDLQSPWLGFPWSVAIQGALLLWIAVVVALLGRALFRRVHAEASGLEATVWGSGLVLGALGTVVFFLGLTGLYGAAQPLFYALLGLATAGAIFATWKAKSRQSDRACRVAFTPAEWGLIGALSLLQLLALLYALTPSVQSDALRYHLAVPQEWLKAGGIVYLPYNSHSNFPSAIEMLYLFGLGLKGDLLAKGFHFLFLPLTTGAVALLTSELSKKSDATQGAEKRDRWSVRPALLAAVVWGVLPLTVYLAGWAFIDLGVAFFTLGVLYFILRWFRSRRPSDWILAGLFGGLLVASKYTGVLTVIGGASLMALGGWLLPSDKQNASARSFSKSLLRAVAFGLIAASIGVPWWIRNTVNTGNPVYPLAYSVFGGGGEWDQTCDDIHKGKLKEKGRGRSLSAFLQLPWATARDWRPLSPFGGFEIGAFFWVFTPWILAWCARALWRFRARPAPAVAACWAAFFLVTWFFTYQSNRFLMSFCSLAVPILILALAQATRRGKVWRLIVALAIALPLAYTIATSACYLLLDAGRANDGVLGVRWPAFTLGYLSRDDFLADRLDYYPAARYANQNLGPDDKVLLVGEHRKMHWQCRVEGRDWYDPPRIQPYLRAAADVDSLLDALIADGFTHVFLNLDEWGWPDKKPDVQLGKSRPTLDSEAAWIYNIQHFTRKDLLLLQKFLVSERLAPTQAPGNDRVRLFRIE